MWQIFNTSGIDYAAANGHLEMVKFLVINGADINVPTKGKLTLLAALDRPLEVVKYLFGERVNVKTPTDKNWTPVHLG